MTLEASCVMKIRRKPLSSKGFVGAAAVALALAGGVVAVGPQQASASTGGGYTRLISGSGTAAFGGTVNGPEGLQFPEVRGGDSDEVAPPSTVTITDRSLSRPGRSGASAGSGSVSKSNTGLVSSFDGLNHRDNRLASGGNQFSLEPPDQGLCVGNGKVLEAVNDVMRVYDTHGNALTAATALNAFYGYAPAINRTTLQFGPFVTDPSCIFDGATQRWFLTVLTLDTDPSTGDFVGTNHLDLAVSTSSDPAGSWHVYRIPVQDNGTAGTPNHHCDGGFCIGDYPHIGADANGFYITTNEYELFADGFTGAQIYAFSKQALAANATSVAVTQFDTAGMDNGNPGFTIWPAQSPVGDFATAAGGTEYFLSSNAAEEANGNGTSSSLLVWGLTNTSSLSGSPALTLSHVRLGVNPYAVPPRSAQKAGSVPLADCLNEASCARLILGKADRFTEVESPLDSNDTRMQQVMWANGKLWGALDTALTVGGVNHAGIEWFVVRPTVKTDGTIGATLALNGYSGVAGNNLIYPAIGVTSSGRGVMAFTVVGADHYPSAGYAGIDAISGVGAVHVAAEGLGPQDGFSGYRAFGDPPRPRWGDYGAAAVDGNVIWIASEYIGQTCTLAQYTAAPFGSCGGTRTALANWGTRISEVSVQ
jgi:hypothetical protein